MTVRLDPAQMAIFRKKFMDTAKTYIGVPYAKNLKKFPSCECWTCGLRSDCVTEEESDGGNR